MSVVPLAVVPSDGQKISEKNVSYDIRQAHQVVRTDTQKEFEWTPDKEVLTFRQRLRRRSKNWLGWLQGSREGQISFLLVVEATLIVSGALVWRSVGPNEGFDTKWWSCFCASYFMFIDVGTQTGISPNDSAGVLAMAIVFSGLGFLFNLTLFGLLVDIVRNTLHRWKREHHRVNLVGHTVILGWTDKTLFLLRERLDAAENNGLDRQSVVVLADRDEAEMNVDVMDYLSQRTNKHDVRCKRGVKGNPNDLRRVSLSSAKDVIVLGSSGSPQESDLEVMRVLVAMSSMQDQVNADGNLIVEARCLETVAKMKSLLPNARGITARLVANHILCLMAKRPGLGICISSMCSFGSGVEFYAEAVKPEHGDTFGKARAYFKRARCVGVKTSDGKLLIAPSDEHKLTPRKDSKHNTADDGKRYWDTLLILAQDRTKIDAPQGPLARMERRMKKLLSPSTMINGFNGIQQKSEEALFRPDVTPASGDLNAEAHSRRPIIVCGFPDDCADLISWLDLQCKQSGTTAKTDVHILSQASIEEREQKLRSKERFQHVDIKHHLGNRTCVEVFQNLVDNNELPLWDADAILVLAEPNFNGNPLSTTMCDTECLTCVLTIDGLCKGNYGDEYMRPLRGHIVCEVLDARLDRLFRRNGELDKMKCVFFPSNAVETGMLTMAANSPDVFNLLAYLVRQTGLKHFHVEPIDKYLSPPEDETKASAVSTSSIAHPEVDRFVDDTAVRKYRPASCNDLQKKVRGPNGDGGILIGWQHKSGDTKIPKLDTEDSDTLLDWSDGDLLVVMHPSPLPQPRIQEADHLALQEA